MTIPLQQTRRIEVIEHPTLIHFNEEFGSDPDLSRYENLRTEVRDSSPCIAYLNELQMDGYLPARIALLLKNNQHDTPFITHTTRSVLFQLKQDRKISEGCFQFLHAKVNAGDFVTVYKLLYILNLYSRIAADHDAHTPDPAFRFPSPEHYSDKLIKSPAHAQDKEELSLEMQSRRHFLKKWLSDLAAKPTCPREAQALIFSIDPMDTASFRERFLSLLDKFENASPIEKFCWEDLSDALSPFSGEQFIQQAYLRLKTETYYKSCVSRVATLRESLERTNAPDLLSQAEKCKKAYNGCIYLLSDSKNMAMCSELCFAASIGNMRGEWQKINNAFNRAQMAHEHRLCACQAQSPASQNELADWPFNSHSLIAVHPREAQGIPRPTLEANAQKTVAVIGCKWGGGHMEVSRGVCNNLTSQGYHAVSVDLPEVLISEDTVHNLFITRWLGKDWTNATLFEGLLKNKAFATINFLRSLTAPAPNAPRYSDLALRLVLQHLLKINPDSVVTTYSAHNEVLIKACEILGIPCMHIATDIANKIETRTTPPTYAHFKMALPFDAAETVGPVRQTTSESQRIFTGPPVKHEYTLPRTEADIQLLKRRWEIDTNKKVVIVSNGKAGGFSSYPEILARKYANTPVEEIPIHLVVLCGKDNTSFQRHLQQNVQPNTNLPMTIELHTSKMEELMAMAAFGGALVGKGGGTTFFEAVTRGTRVLVDDVRPHFFFQGVRHFLIACLESFLRLLGYNRQLPWEKANTHFAKQHGLADTFKEESEFLPKLERILNNDNLPVRHNIAIKNVEEEIPKHLAEMMLQAERDQRVLPARNLRRTI